MSASETMKKLMDAQRFAPFGAGIDGLARGLEVLMNTPGASTDDPPFRKTLETSLSPVQQRAAQKMQQELQDRLAKETALRLKGNEYDQIWTDELEKTEVNTDIDDKAMLEAGLADLAQEMTDAFKELQGDTTIDACRLTSGESLTVLTRVTAGGGSYAKVGHIGGEEFIPSEAYVGKKGKILVKFKPTSVASYVVMEMPADEALTKLEGFDLLSVLKDGTSYRHRIATLRSAGTRIREQEANKDRFEEYKDLGFGTF